MDTSFKLPAELLALIDADVWPNANNELRQNLNPIVSVETIRNFATDEESLYLHPPPFRTVADHAEQNGFWGEHAAPTELDFANALVLGDFGLGSDAPIVLDYSDSPGNSSVKRLQWNPEGNHWVKICDTFSKFADILRLTRT